MGYRVRVPLWRRIPTVLVRLATDEGEIAFRARWKRSALELQRSILYHLRKGRPLWFQDERGRDLCFKPEHVWGAMVVGLPAPPLNGNGDITPMKRSAIAGSNA